MIHSSAILGIAYLATLRYQRGERKTSFRIRVRRTTDRVLCDECFEDSLVQLALAYVVTGVAVVLILVGLRDLISQGSALPLRVVALGLAVGVLGDDAVAYLVTALEPGNREPEDGVVRASGADPDGTEEPEIEFDSDTPAGDERPTEG